MAYDDYLISKAERAYRDSVFAPINPLSHTEVREGSMHRRAARRYGGGLAGAAAGYGAGTLVQRGLRNKSPIGAAIAGRTALFYGGALGNSVGRTANIKSGDTRATGKRLGGRGRKATGAITVPLAGSFWTYGK